MEDLNKIKEELEKQSKEFEEEKKKKMEALMQKRADLLANFLSNQQESEYSKITKISYIFTGNAVEDYIQVSVYEKDKVLMVCSNLLGIEHLDSFPNHLAENLMRFVYSNYMDLVEIDRDTKFEINFEQE